LEKAFSMILKETIAVTGCGRTDTGVHAKNYVAHFDSTSEELENETNLVHKLNRFLPKEIAIQYIQKMHPDAHARFDATSRTYQYFISKNKDPFHHPFSYTYQLPLRVDLMNLAASQLFHYIDFTSFSKVDTDVKTNNCKIMEAYWQETEQQLVFTIKADRFLRNMVRAIVGTLLEVGKEKLTMEEFRQIIEAKDRCKAGHSAKAQALFLVRVEYPYSIVC
jgi:tRNA pseudouridine38-40 synthase